MNVESIAANLRTIRKARKLSQEDLATKAHISRAGYRNIEMGQAVPRVATLLALAGALGVKLEELVRPAMRLHRVRFRSTKSLKSREQVLARVGRWLEDFADLEMRLRDHCRFSLADLGRPGSGERHAIKLAGEARAKLKLKPQEPIRDICGLLESAGIKVYPIVVATDGFFGLSVAKEDGGPAVIVNTWERITVERWIFTAAHELGHLLLHLSAFDVQESGEEEREEKEANLFAGQLLMPQQGFKNEWDDTYGLPFVDRVLKVKRIFRVSYTTVLYRLSTDSSLGPSVWVRFQADYKRRYERALPRTVEPEALAAGDFRASMPVSNPAEEPDVLRPSDFLEDRLSALVRRGIEKGAISMSRGAEILDLSLQEMRELAASWVD